MGNKSCLPLVTIFDSHVVVSPVNIEFGENIGVSQFIYKIREERKGVGITDGVFIDIMVVLARTESSVFLFDKEEGGCLR